MSKKFARSLEMMSARTAWKMIYMKMFFWLWPQRIALIQQAARRRRLKRRKSSLRVGAHRPERAARLPTFSLTLAPSVNSMYRNVPRVGRVKASAYREWIRGELKSLVFQKAKPVQPPVSVRIVLPIGTRGDPDNRQKAVLDLLKRAGVIPDDSGKIIKALSVCYGAGKDMEVSVESI